MPSKGVTQTAKKIVGILNKFPEDRIRHSVNFKSSQIQRFCNIGGIPLPKELVEAKKKEEENKKGMLNIDTDKIKEVLFSETDKPVNYQNDLFTEDVLQQQYKSLKNIQNSKWEQYYKIDTKLRVPKGNPNYYKRLLKDLDSGGQVKENFFTAMRTVLTGKY